MENVIHTRCVNNFVEDEKACPRETVHVSKMRVTGLALSRFSWDFRNRKVTNKDIERDYLRDKAYMGDELSYSS